MRYVFCSLLVLAVLLSPACVQQQDSCGKHRISADDYLSSTKYEEASAVYLQAAECYRNASKVELAKENYLKAIEGYKLEGKKEEGEGNSKEAGRNYFDAAKVSLIDIGDMAAAVEYAHQAVTYYEKANVTGFQYYASNAIYTGNVSFLDKTAGMIELLGDESLRKTRDEIQEKLK